MNLIKTSEYLQKEAQKAIDNLEIDRAERLLKVDKELKELFFKPTLESIYFKDKPLDQLKELFNGFNETFTK